MNQKIKFLNWKGKKGKKYVQCPKLYIHYEKTPLLFEYNYINNSRRPFFSMLNARGTIKCFIDALHKNAYEEARGYISKLSSHLVDLEELSCMFQNIKQYQYLVSPYFSMKKNRISNISIASNDNAKPEFIHLQMIEEPNQFGKWKIICIEKV